VNRFPLSSPFHQRIDLITIRHDPVVVVVVVEEEEEDDDKGFTND